MWASSIATMVAITVVWMALYGIGFLLSFLPTQYPSISGDGRAERRYRRVRRRSGE